LVGRDLGRNPQTDIATFALMTLLLQAAGWARWRCRAVGDQVIRFWFLIEADDRAAGSKVETESQERALSSRISPLRWPKRRQGTSNSRRRASEFTAMVSDGVNDAPASAPIRPG
jgi:hypothetical protein